jgi:hypothetical protein
VLVREVPGYYGGTVPTSFAFQKAWAWFVSAAGQLRGVRTLINCTEGGARIDGMEHAPLADVAARYAREAVDVAGVLDAKIREIDRVARRRQMLDRTGEILDGIGRCAALARKCLHLSRLAETERGALKALTCPPWSRRRSALP